MCFWKCGTWVVPLIFRVFFDRLFMTRLVWVEVVREGRYGRELRSEKSLLVPTATGSMDHESEVYHGRYP